MPSVLLGMSILLVITAVVILVIIIVVLVVISRNDGGESRQYGPGGSKKPGLWEWDFTPEYKRVGTRGEEAITHAIESVLHENDRLFTNVRIEYDGKQTELDNVIVNRYGVFIIEVKNYTGYILGKEDDYEWRKFKTTDAGNTYEKNVKNPIKQVKRQIFILAHYLEYYGSRVWVKGYAILLHGNSPIASDYLLNSVADIDSAIHTRDRTILNATTIEKIIKLLT